MRPVDFPPVLTAHMLRPGPAFTRAHTQVRAAKKRAGKNPCMWFGGCDKPATGVVAHPTLGDVPTCDSCAAFAKGN